MTLNKTFIVDIAERVAATFGEVFLAQLIASGWFTVGGMTDTSTLTKAAIAGLGAVLALVKGLLASRVGNPSSAALLPAPPVEGNIT